MYKLKTMVVTTGVVSYGPEVLVLRRREDARYTPNLWESVSGFLGEFEKAEACALREVGEEAGLEGRITTHAPPLEVEHDGVRWIVLPYRIEASSKNVVISPEHQGYRWIQPGQLSSFDCVPKTREVMEVVGIVFPNGR